MNVEALETTPRVLFLTSGYHEDWHIHTLLIVPTGAVVGDDIKAFNDTLDGGTIFVPVSGSACITNSTMTRREKRIERRRADAIRKQNDAAFLGPINASLKAYAKQYGIEDNEDTWCDARDAKIIGRWLCENRGYQWAEGRVGRIETPSYDTTHEPDRLVTLDKNAVEDDE